MADLKPLGSEKLEGMEKINRILEISRFNEHTPTPINETDKSEYKLFLADGNEYQIVKEKSGYIIKKTLTESETDYIEPMENRKYYRSYSQALKRLNLMAKETNLLHGNDSGVSLFSEQKKFVLKTPEKKNPEPAPDVENIPAPPVPGDTQSIDMGIPEPPPLDGEEMPMDDIPSEEGMDAPPMDMDAPEGQDEEVTFKLVQKLVGKVSQKLRTLDSNDELSNEEAKYVINSILSAIDLTKLEPETIDEILSKFEEDEEGMEDMGDMGDDMSMSEPEMTPEEPTMPDEGGEMGESWSDLAQNAAMRTISKGITPGQFKEETDDDHIQMIADEMFAESKIESVLRKYFVISEDEKKYNDKRNAMREKKPVTASDEIKRLSESVKQEKTAMKIVEKYKTAKLIGKTNLKNLVFEYKNKQYKVSTEGKIL